MVTPGGHEQIAIEQLDYDGSSGRFTGMLAVASDDMAMLRMRLSGTLQEMLEVPVPAHRLAIGSVIQAGDLQMARVRAGLAGGDVVRDPAQAIGRAVRQQAMAGQPLPLAELTSPASVQKGDVVAMRLLAPGLNVAAQGRALESGGLGDRVAVLNPSSRAVVVAEVTGADQVRVLPGTQPSLPSGSRQVQIGSAAIGSNVP
jgi:flagella basal body P-ring formation protein FlgA